MFSPLFIPICTGCGICTMHHFTVSIPYVSSWVRRYSTSKNNSLFLIVLCVRFENHLIYLFNVRLVCETLNVTLHEDRPLMIERIK